jgi:hypothetical protein
MPNQEENQNKQRHLQESEIPLAPIYTIPGPRLARSVGHEQIGHSHSVPALTAMTSPLLLHRTDTVPPSPDLRR